MSADHKRAVGTLRCGYCNKRWPCPHYRQQIARQPIIEGSYLPPEVGLGAAWPEPRPVPVDTSWVTTESYPKPPSRWDMALAGFFGAAAFALLVSGVWAIAEVTR